MSRKHCAKVPSPLAHKNTRGEICEGKFQFAKSRSSDDFAVRSCDGCRRHETYDLHRLILVAKESISDVQLREFCALLVQRVESARLGKVVSFDPSQIVISTDKSNQRRYAATITAQNIGTELEPEKFLRSAAEKMRERTAPRPPAFDEIIEWVWRKPVACDQDGNVVPY